MPEKDCGERASGETRSTRRYRMDQRRMMMRRKQNTLCFCYRTRLVPLNKIPSTPFPRVLPISMDPEKTTSTQSGEPSESSRPPAPTDWPQRQQHPTTITDPSSSKPKRIGVSFTHHKVFLGTRVIALPPSLHGNGFLTLFYLNTRYTPCFPPNVRRS